jgi:GntR family transcriptional repressor for pyruvate dehydrogenase complex
LGISQERAKLDDGATRKPNSTRAAPVEVQVDSHEGEVNPELGLIDEFEPILRVDITAEIIGRIKTLLARGKLKPGDRLPPEREFAKLLGVGRPVLRQALKALATLGVLESRIGHGTYVTTSTTGLLAAPIDFIILMQATTLPELFEVRKTIEVELAGLAAERASDQDLALIGSIIENQSRNLSNPQGFLVEDLNFHNAIAGAVCNVLFRAILDSLRRLMVETRRKLLLTGDDLSNSLADHKAIFQAISNRRKEDAHQAMLRHLNRVYHLWEETQRRRITSLDVATASSKDALP